MVRAITRRMILAATAGLAALAGAAEAKQEWRQVRIGVEGAYPPFSEVGPDGKLKGFDIDIAHALCRRMQVRCAFVQQSWDEIIPGLLASKYDAVIASMSITEERRRRIDFTDEYYRTPAKFVRKKGSGIEITPEDLRDRRVGVQRATTHDSYLTDAYGAIVEIVRYDTQKEASRDLVAGRIDLLLGDARAVQEGLLETAAGRAFEFVGPDVSDSRWFGEGNGIAVRKEDADLRRMLNAALQAIRADGTYAAIAGKYFPYDISGS